MERALVQAPCGARRFICQEESRKLAKLKSTDEGKKRKKKKIKLFSSSTEEGEGINPETSRIAISIL